jgi:membrane associated rhomboid family serine protease
MSHPYCTYAIIAATVAVSITGFGNRRLFEKNLFSVRAIVENRELYRLITSQFFHANWAHLLFNMISLYSFGDMMERNYGPGLTAALYAAGALGGDLLALAIRRKTMDYSAVGASGAVCAIIFASIFLLPGGSIYILPIPVPLPSWVYAVLFMVISLYGIGREGSLIGHDAHIGGALAGIIGAAVYSPLVVYQNYILLIALTVPVIVQLVYYIRKA